jgi:hypothetical protein
MAGYEYDLEQKTVLLRIDLPDIQEIVQKRIQEDGFQLNSEFHITIGQANGMDVTARKCQRFVETLNHLTEPNIQYTDDIYEIMKPTFVETVLRSRSSLVVPIVSGSVESDLRHMAVNEGIVLPQRFLHVTLATSPDTEVARRGIAIASLAVWETMEPELYATDWRT